MAKILDDQPADSDRSVQRAEDAARFQGPQQHDSACRRERQAEDQRGFEGPTPARGRCAPERGGDRDLQ
jgi:hypothetical protein